MLGSINERERRWRDVYKRQMYAGLVIVMVPTLILYILVQKKLTEGMSLGGLKD